MFELAISKTSRRGIKCWETLGSVTTGETHSTVRGCDMQLLLFITPFLLYNFFQEEVEDWNQKHPLDPKIDPTSLIIPVVTTVNVTV